MPSTKNWLDAEKQELLLALQGNSCMRPGTNTPKQIHKKGDFALYTQHIVKNKYRLIIKVRKITSTTLDRGTDVLVLAVNCDDAAAINAQELFDKLVELSGQGIVGTATGEYCYQKE